MSAGEEDPNDVVSLQEVLEEDQELESTANAVLGDSEDAKCSYYKGYVDRQALYACGTCEGVDGERAGMCLACSLHCHDGHDLYELYTKRHFRCDCGNDKFPGFTCTLNPEKEPVNAKNKYNQNFVGLYCSCNRPYPDSEDDVEDEMIQCVVCEDWFHSRHLVGKAPPTYEEMVCDVCMGSHDFLHAYQLHTTPTLVEKEDQGNSSPSNKTNLPQSSPSLDVAGANQGPESSSNDGNHSDSAAIQCELARRRALSNNLSISNGNHQPTGAGYFEKNWRSQLCRCTTCKELYESLQCQFLLEESDTLLAYEARALPRQSSHEAAFEALGELGHVQKVEAIHHYSDLKSKLSNFLTDFARNKKVVSKRDIEGFFEGMTQQKRQRLETGDGVPPANCHF